MELNRRFIRMVSCGKTAIRASAFPCVSATSSSSFRLPVYGAILCPLFDYLCLPSFPPCLPQSLRVDPFLRKQSTESLDEFDLLFCRKVRHGDGEYRLRGHVSLPNERSVVAIRIGHE